MSSFQTLSPLERVFGDHALGTHVLLDGIMQQVEEFCNLPPAQQAGFKFSIDRKDALVARDELRCLIATAESSLDNCAEVFATEFFPNVPTTKVYVARGVCEANYNLPTKSRFIIGKDIHPGRFTHALESKEHLLAETFRPICDICQTDDKHTTTSSYTRILPSWLLPKFDASDDVARDRIQKMHTLQKYTKLLNYYTMENKSSHIRSTIDRINAANVTLEQALRDEDRVEGELRDTVSKSDLPVMFIQERVKYGGRKAEKIVRMAAERYLELKRHVLDLPPINDVYGIKFVTRDEFGEYSPEVVKEAVIALATKRYGLDTVTDIRRDRRVVDERVVFDAWKFHMLWGNKNEGHVPMISAQVQSFKNYRDDQDDHKAYEARELKKVAMAQELGFKADELRAELDKMLSLHN